MTSPAEQNREVLEQVVGQIVDWLKEELQHERVDPANLEPTEKEADDDNGPFMLRFPCPRARFYGDSADNPHRNRGGPLSYKDRSHRAYAYTSGGQVVLKCQCCTNGSAGATVSPEDYKAEIIDEIGLTIGNVVHIGGGEVRDREHPWPCPSTGGTLWHVKYKASKHKRTWKWRWEYEEPETGVRFTLRKSDDDYQRSAEFLFGHSAGEEAGIYNQGRMDIYPHAALVFCEGEKDAEMAETLIQLARAEERMIGVCSPYTQIGSGQNVPPSFVNPFVGRNVITCFDRDKAGDNFRQDWSDVLYDLTQSWAVILLEVGEEYGDPAKFNDLSDWVEKQGGVSLETAQLFVRIVEEATPMTERPRGRDHWMIFPSRSDQGKPHQNNEDNGYHILRYHPQMRDVIHRHAITGDIVTIDAPFHDGVKVWENPDALAGALSIWFTEATPFSVGPRSFSLRMLRKVAERVPAWSPYEEMLSTTWDGTGRAEQLFIDHIPLDCSEDQARALGRMVMTDIARALQGHPKPLSFKQLVILVPRDIFGISLARIITPSFSAYKQNESPKENTVTALMRAGASLIQFPAKSVTNYRNRVASMEVLQASDFDVAGERIGAPAFFFVGEMNHTDLSDVPPTYLIENLRGQDLTPISDSLLAQMVAEAIDRKDEWELLPEPVTQSTAHAEDARERFEAMGALIAYYVFNKVELDAVNGPASHHAIISNTISRPEPLEVVDFNAVTSAMSAYARHVYGTRFNEQMFTKERTAFFRFLLDAPDRKRFQYRKNDKMRAGVRLDDETVSKLYQFHPDAGFDLPKDSDPDPNQGSGSSDNCVDAPLDTPAEPDIVEVKEEDSGATHRMQLPSAHTERGGGELGSSHVRADAYIIEGEVSSDLPEEWREAATLLAEAGPCGIDFESSPGDPAYWVEKDKAEAKGKLPKGWAAKRKLEIQKQNIAPKRQPCILTLAKPGGRKAWVRLPGTVSEAREALRQIFANVHPDIELIAHNAIFEAEVLAAAGLFFDIQCTMVASKLIYAEAFAWDDDDDSGGAFIPFATGEEDVGIVGPDGQLDLERLGPIGMPRYHSLAACMEREFGVKRDKTLRSIDWASETALEPEYVDYALEDAVNVLDLWEIYEEALRRIGIWEGYWNLMQALPAVAEINTGGLRVDRSRYDAYMAKLAEEVEVEKSKLYAINQITPAKKNMNDAMKWWCVGQLWDGLVTASGQDDTEMMFTSIREMDAIVASFEDRPEIPRSTYWTTIRDCIEEAGYEIGSTRGRFNRETERYDQPDIGLDKSGVRKMIEFLDQTGIAPELLAYLKLYRSLNKSSTLLVNLGPSFEAMIDGTTHRIVGHHQLAGAVTGRQSCREVNLQQIPVEGDARSCFVADPGNNLIVADYSQVELRVGAVEAKDDALFDVYVRGVDVHTATAAKCFHMREEDVPPHLRKKAKAVNFGCLYGAAGPAIAESALCSLAEAEELLGNFLGAYPGIANYREEKSHETGDIFIVPGRRVMATSEVQGPKRVNYPVQGGAASVQHLALRLVWEALRPLSGRVWIRAAIHDEIVVECHESVAERVRDAMKEAMTVALLTLYPTCVEMGRDRLVSIEIGHDWSEKE